jgi:hypothetical protein
MIGRDYISYIFLYLICMEHSSHSELVKRSYGEPPMMTQQGPQGGGYYSVYFEIPQVEPATNLSFKEVLSYIETIVSSNPHDMTKLTILVENEPPSNDQLGEMAAAPQYQEQQQTTEAYAPAVEQAQAQRTV